MAALARRVGPLVSFWRLRSGAAGEVEGEEIGTAAAMGRRVGLLPLVGRRLHLHEDRFDSAHHYVEFNRCGELGLGGSSPLGRNDQTMQI